MFKFVELVSKVEIAQHFAYMTVVELAVIKAVNEAHE